MLSARWRRVALPALACLMAACNSGDDDGSGRPQPGPVVGVPAPEVAVCGAADLSALKTRVHVSPQGSDGAGCGQTGATACKTIQQGIANCAAAGCGVLVRWGLYPTSATIELRDAVNVYGGCLFDGETARGYRTTVQASPAPGTPAVSASGIHTATLFSGIVVIGKNETAAGAASLTMVVADSKGLALSQTVLVSGTGGDGENGGAAAAAAPGQDGLDGNFGDIPSMSGGAGAGGQACNGSTTAGAGGTGADYRLLDASGCFATCKCRPYQGGSGSNGADAGNVKGGAGGGAGDNGRRCDGTHGEVAGPGVQGVAGAPGACAASAGVAAANPWGSLGPAGWSPGVGGTGAAGDMGSGGGGGGAGGVCVNILFPDGNSLNSNGMPGGGGGGGGCGGPGGQGGQQGGASIPLLLSGSALGGVDASLSLVAGPPGRGGHGGSGGTGGSGGQGGSTPFRKSNPPMTACKYLNNVNAGYGGDGGPGGDGGRGGAGSGGPGGSGGASIGVALRAASTAPTTAIVYPPLPGGTGGSGGAGGQNAPIPDVDPSPCGGAYGQAGLQGGSAAIMDFDLPLASMLLPGQQLPESYAIRSPNGNVLFVMQSDDNLCLYVSGNPVWCSDTQFEGIEPYAVMQADGNFCVTIIAASGWCSGTAGHPGAHLIVQDSGHVQIVAADATVLWSKP